MVSNYHDKLSFQSLLSLYLLSLQLKNRLITLHAQRERGKVIGVGVHIQCLYVCGPKKKFESYFSD